MSGLTVSGPKVRVTTVISPIVNGPTVSGPKVSGPKMSGHIVRDPKVSCPIVWSNCEPSHIKSPHIGWSRS